ncbi:MAG: hypothetical protein BGO49_07185 [Planctomycetales bacterium 71-10]|nr:MAG: hypothetical protein BGO49_07185 [Planctomycetales bacterium 71-10]
MGVEPRGVLRDAIAAIESAAPGASHSVLASQSQRVAWLVARGELDEREALEALRAAGDRRGKPTAEVDAAWESAMKKAAPAPSPAPASKVAPPKKSKAPATKKTVYPGLDDAARRTSFAMDKPHRGTWVYRDASGADAMAVVRYGDGEAKEFRPYHPAANGWVVGDPDGPLPLYRLPELIRDPAAMVAVCEGEKAADLAAGLGIPATTAAHGAKSPHKTDWSQLAGRKVVILPDADDAGERYAASVTALLQALNPPAEVRIVRLPGLPPKGDVEQFIQAGGTAEKLWELIEAAPTESVDDGPPVVVITPNESEVAAQALAALAARDSNLYVLAGRLATIVERGDAPRGIEFRDEPPPQVQPLETISLRGRITACTRLVKYKKNRDGEDVASHAHPPEWLAPMVHKGPEFPGVRPLEGVIQAPTIRRDGSILDRPGYDRETRLFYRPNARFDAVPERPTRREAEAAWAALKRLLCDFPFRSEVDLALWLASLLTVLGRPLFDGPSPLIGFDGNCPGVGKTLLADVVAIMATGRPVSKMGFPGGAHGDEEMDKRITALAMAGVRLVLLDNVAEPLGGSSLDRALTTTLWQGRPLGRSEIVDMPLAVTWLASGNNLQVKGDMLRRVLFARLETREENPEDRQGFRIPNLLRHVRENRGRLAASALTILRAWRVAGSPRTVDALGSFEGWTEGIADPVAWITNVDPLAVRAAIKAADMDAGARESLVAGWAELPGSESGLTIAAALKILRAHGHDDKFTALRSALAEMSKTADLPPAQVVGKKLKTLEGLPISGFVLRSDFDRTNTKVWRIERSSAGSAGSLQGVDFPHSLQGKQNGQNDLRLNAGSAGSEIAPSREVFPPSSMTKYPTGTGNIPGIPSTPCSGAREVFEL